MTDKQSTVGFIGLGLMGEPIAVRLKEAGFRVTTIERHRAQADRLGFNTVANPLELARACPVIFTCLPAPAASREVYLEPDGLIEGTRTDALLIELSTVDPATVKDIAGVCAGAPVDFIDAPVSGGPGGAGAGKLTLMAGGSEAAFERARPFFDTFASRCFHMGPVGTGIATKLCNQMLTGVTHVLVSEAMALGRKAGLDPQRLYDVLRVSSGQSNSLERAVPNFIVPRQFDAAFALNGIYKDLECVAQMGKQTGVRLLLAAVAQQIYEEARGAGLGHKDVASVYLAVERAAGIAAD